jgi:hypothetical protein
MTVGNAEKHDFYAAKEPQALDLSGIANLAFS